VGEEVKRGKEKRKKKRKEEEIGKRG